jgi:gliding motility-associated-like protein
MKEIKDIFENYEQKPSDEVWNRLNARLDAEMPVANKVVNRGISKTWKLVAAVVATVVLAGSIALVSLMHIQGDRPQEQKETVREQTSNNTEVVVEESENSVEEVAEPLLADTHPVVETVAETEKPSQKEVAAPKPQEAAAKSAQKQNTRQEVLPANSTLARQLAADPVLKNLSDGSVDWSMPAHLSIPNLFTPNNDGVNDLFIIEGIEQYASPKLVIRDKNNRIVYQNVGYQNNWGGENCPDGVYSYEFTFNYNGIESQATGKVRIIRS